MFLVRTILFAFLMIFATQVNAFSKTLWDLYDEREQKIHLLGAFEGLMINPSPNEITLYGCFRDTKINADQLHELVVEEYNSSFWKHSNQENVPASAVLLSALKQFCIAKGYSFE
mgnify:CR=1 FL=1